MSGQGAVNTFVKLFAQDTTWAVVPEEEPRLDAAVSLYVDSGGTRDALLQLTLTGGDTLTIKASLVRCWMVSTPEGRRREMELSKESDDEEKAIKQELGMWED